MCQSHRSRQTRFPLYSLLYERTDLCLGSKQLQTAGHIEESFVERQTFQQRREIPENRKHLGRFFPVPRHSRANEMCLRTKTPRPAHRQGRVYSVDTRLVAGRCDNPAGTQATDYHRLPLQRRIVQAFHRCVKRIHIHVDDRALR